MKFSTTVMSALAPVALAKSVHNHYPKHKRDTGYAVEDGGDYSYDAEGDESNWEAEEESAGNWDAESSESQEGCSEEAVVIWAYPGGDAETKTMREKAEVTHAASVDADGATVTGVAPGATHTVVVGGPAGLVYVPDHVEAAIGDMVIFEFLAANHTTTQSTFDAPCEPLEGGMKTGFVPNADNAIVPAPQVAMQVMVDTPLWFYCGQGPHCGKGMTFSINPTADKSQAMFQAMAIEMYGDGTASPITGGEAEEAEESAWDYPAGGSPTGAAWDSPEGVDWEYPEGAAPTGTAWEYPTGAAEVVEGTGTVLPDGTCACAVVCGEGAFPAAGAQGIGNYGGMAGALPATLVEKI